MQAIPYVVEAFISIKKNNNNKIKNIEKHRFHNFLLIKLYFYGVKLIHLLKIKL